MNSSIHNVLKTYGLTDNQIEVYLTLLRLNAAPASAIARNTGIKRVSIYPVLHSLLKLGLVTEHISWESKYFSATHPENIQKKEEIKLAQLKESVPELVALMGNFYNKPKLSYFEGFEWLKNLYRQLLTSKVTMKSFLWSTTIDNELKTYLNKKFLPERIKRWIRAKVLLPEADDIAKNYAAHPEQTANQEALLTEIKMLKKKTFMLSNEIDLFDEDKVSVVLFNQGELSWFIIQNKSFHDSLESIFDLLWETA